MHSRYSKAIYLRAAPRISVTLYLSRFCWDQSTYSFSRGNRATPITRPPVIAFDETGNTGQNLLDPDQPVFVLASVVMDEDEASDVLKIVALRGASESKFSRISKSNPGRRRVLELLDSDFVRDDRLKLSVYHKSFMVTTKIVDLLVEPFLHARGVDLYENAGNLGLANLLHAVTGVFCGPGAFVELQSRFVTMSRRPTDESVEAFYEQLGALSAANKNEGFRETLDLLMATRETAYEAVNLADVTSLDPAVPAFVDLAAQWTNALKVPFEIVHDISKPIAHQQVFLERLMSFAEPGREFLAAGANWTLPILATGIRFADSTEVPQLQIADLVAGATATLWRAKALSSRDRFAESLAKTRFGQLSCSPVWPTTRMTPDELHASQRSSTEALNYTIALAAREKERRG